MQPQDVVDFGQKKDENRAKKRRLFAPKKGKTIDAVATFREMAQK